MFLIKLAWRLPNISGRSVAVTEAPMDTKRLSLSFVK